MTQGGISLLHFLVPAIVAVLLWVCYATVLRDYEPEESFMYNVFALVLQPIMFPSILNVIDKPMEAQVARHAKITADMEASVSEAGAKMFGPDYWQANYGPEATRVTSIITIPSSGDDDDHAIPVICTCPHNATATTTMSSNGLPMVFYYHGGGLIMGSIQAEMILTRWLARQANAVVCSIGYRKPPLYPYPTPMQDAFDASVGILRDINQVQQALGGIDIDTTRLATWGTSAGGYMSAQLARRLVVDADVSSLKVQVSIIPMVKPHGGTPSILNNWHKARGWKATENAYAWTTFLAQDPDGTTLASDWRVSLLVDPPTEKQEMLPPAYVQINTVDILRDEGEMYANRLQAMGKLIGMDEYDTTHIGTLPGFSNGGRGEGAFEKAVQVLKAHIHN